MRHTATHCNTLHHTATHCSTLQHTAAHCNTLQHTATHCNTMHSRIRNALCHTRESILRCSDVCVAVCCSVLQCVAMCCNMLQCVAMCCSGNVSCVVLMSHIVFVHLICHAHRGVVSRARKHPVFAQQNILRIIMHRPCRARELVTYYAQTHLVCAHACIEGMREMCAFAEHRYIHTFIECMSIHSMNV